MTGRMPFALSFSPDGQKLALGAWTYLDGCATPTTYYVGNADGSDLQALPVASLAAFGGHDEQMYLLGDSLVWTPDSQGLWVKGQVKDCGGTRNTVGGPQISHVTLDGQEHEIIPGTFGALPDVISVDRTGSLLGVMNTDRRGSLIQILGLDGHLVLDLGIGEFAVLQP